MRVRMNAMADRIHCPPDEIHAIVDRIHCPPGEIHATGDRIHCLLREIHATVDRIHCPPYEIHATADRIHCPPGEIHATARRIHAYRRRTHVPRQPIVVPARPSRSATASIGISQTPSHLCRRRLRRSRGGRRRALEPERLVAQLVLAQVALHPAVHVAEAQRVGGRVLLVRPTFFHSAATCLHQPEARPTASRRTSREAAGRRPARGRLL